MEFIPQFFSSSPLGRIGIVTLKDRRAHSKGNQFLFHYYEYLKGTSDPEILSPIHF